MRRKRSPSRSRLPIAILFALAASGCSPDRRYEVLSFFFDGVPDPSAPPHDEKVSSQYFTDGGPLSVTKLELTFHPPYKEGRCTGCHPREASLAIEEAGRRKLCFLCHEHDRLRAEIDGYRFVHGPVAVESCLACHDPHESIQPKLLVQKDPKICLSCHDREAVIANPVHSGAGPCLGCHAPHGGSSRYFLRDEARPAPVTQS